MSLCYDFQKWLMITFGLVGVSLTIGSLLISFAHGEDWYITRQNVGPLANFTRTAQNGTQYNCQEGSGGKVIGCSPIETVTPALNTTQQTETEPRSYENCYKGFSATIIMAMMFSPPEAGLNLMTLADPQVKQYISDLCKFYHEKTGIWLTFKPLDEYETSLRQQYDNEFFQTHELPEAFKKLRDMGN
jgi:hypothetical protein